MSVSPDTTEGLTSKPSRLLLGETGDECMMVEAITRTFPNFREIASNLTEEEVRVGNFYGNKDHIEWHGKCAKCLGCVTVRNVFNDELNGPHATAALPDACPLKPSPEDAPVMFIEHVNIGE